MSSKEENKFWHLALFITGVYLYKSVFLQKTKKPTKHITSSLIEDELTSELNSMVPQRSTTTKVIDDTEYMYAAPSNDSISLAEPLVKKITETSTSEIIVIGIAGGSGSGKTTLAKAIYESIGEDNITFLSHDSYYRDLSHLTVEERGNQNFDHPDSLETSLLVEHVLALKNKKTVCIPSYDYTMHSRVVGTTAVSPRPVVLVEGILIFSDKALYDLIDIKIFVDTDDDIRLIRRMQRDTQERGRTLMGVIGQYISTVRPMHLQFVEPSKRNADIIIPVGLNSVALDLVVNKLKSHLSDSS